MKVCSVAMPLGNHLAVHHWGNLAGPPLVVAHGFMDSAESFQTAMRPLFDRWHVIAPDQRGHGASEHIGAGGYYHFTDYVLDMHALVTGLPSGQPAPAFVGHSMGASVGVYLAGAFPECLSALVLVDGIGPPSGSSSDGPALMRRWIERVASVVPSRSTPSAQSRAGITKRLRGSTPGLDDDAREAMVAARTRSLGGGQVEYRFDRLHRTPGPWHVDRERFEAFCAAIEVPTLSIWGGNTPFRHSEVDGREALIPRRESITIPDAGHNIHLEQPLALGRCIAQFLERVCG